MAKKKKLNVNIDTPIVDVKYDRNDLGEVDVKIDTKLVDAHYTKDIDGKKKLEILDGDTYDFEITGKAEHLPKGTICRLTGELVKIFLSQKLGIIKKKIK
jgi:hypothetical protein